MPPEARGLKAIKEDLVAKEALPPFNGFSESESSGIEIPEVFFTDLLPLLNDPVQLRVLLYLFWHQTHQQERVRYFRLEELAADPVLTEMFGDLPALSSALDGLTRLGAILKADLEWMNETYYFINSPQGRAAVRAMEAGDWQGTNKNRPPVQLAPERPNIYQLYEENIGPITPMTADLLKEDEADYPPEWIEEAVRQAVARNARNWKYVQAILKRWRTEGRGNEQNRRDNSQSPEDYRKGWLGRD